MVRRLLKGWSEMSEWKGVGHYSETFGCKHIQVSIDVDTLLQMDLRRYK